MADITQILEAVERGDTRAAADLLPLVYAELRKLAARHLADEKPGQTLQATALVHEAYLRPIGGEVSVDWNGRGHFFGAAAEAMRRILVDAARSKGRSKRGGDRHRLDLEDVHASPAEVGADDLLAVDSALDALARFDPTKAEVVKLRYFARLTIDQTAACMNLSPATVKRLWAVARAWLYRHLTAGNPDGTDRNS